MQNNQHCLVTLSRNSRIWRDFFKGNEKAHSTELSMLFSEYYRKLKKNGLDQIYVRLILKKDY